MRRKTLENNIKSYFNLSSEIVDKIIEECNFPKQLRGEKLTTDEIIKLSSVIVSGTSNIGRNNLVIEKTSLCIDKEYKSLTWTKPKILSIFSS